MQTIVFTFPRFEIACYVGYDYAQGKGSVYVPAEAASELHHFRFGLQLWPTEKKTVC